MTERMVVIYGLRHAMVRGGACHPYEGEFTLCCSHPVHPDYPRNWEKPVHWPESKAIAAGYHVHRGI